MTTKEYLIKTTFDDAGMTQFQIDAKKAQIAAQSMGLAFSDAAKVVDQTLTLSLNKAGGTVRTVTSILEEGGKKARVSFTDMGESVKNVSGGMQTAGTVAGTFSGEISKLVSRAILVVPVWEALRFAIKGVEDIFVSSIKFMVDWETELAKVRAVTGATKEQLDVLSPALINLSERFAISTKDVADSANQWLRMGATLDTVIPLLTATSKLSLISGQSMEDSAKAVNSIISAFGLSSAQASTAVDKLIAVEEKSGVSLDVLTTGFQKAGLTAKSMGLSFDQLAGYIVAVNEKSRQSGDLIGTQLRSMFIRLGSTAITTAQAISQVPFYLDKAGQATQTQTPVLRNMGDIIKDLAASWGTLSNAQQAALARTLGGNLRQTAVIALLSNYNAALKASSEAANSAGGAQEALGARLDTVQSKVVQLQTAWSRFVNSPVIVTGIKGTLDFMRGAIENTSKTLENFRKLMSDSFTHDYVTHEHPELAKFLNAPGKTATKTEVSEDIKIQSTAQKQYNTDLLTTEQIKNGIQQITEHGVRTNEDSLVTIQKEIDLLNKADGQASIATATELQSLIVKKEKLEQERQLLAIQEKEAEVMAQMKADGASALQIAIQQAYYAKLNFGANSTQAIKADKTVQVEAIKQERSIQDDIISALSEQAKLQGENEAQILSGKNALEEQLGIHLQGIDLLKQQLDLYKAIQVEKNKSPEQRRRELNEFVHAQEIQQRRNRGSFGETEANNRAELNAERHGVSSQTVNSFLHPETIGGGENSLQDSLKRALSDPLHIDINVLAKTIDKLSESITHTRNFETPHFETPGANLTISQVPHNYEGKYGRASAVPTPVQKNVTLDIGGIHIGFTAKNRDQLSAEVKKELTELIQAHLLKAGTKINKATQQVIENF